MTQADGIVLGNVYNKYESRNPLARWMLQNYLAAFHELVSRLDPGRVLEVGCGEGYLGRILSDWFPRARITGIDLSPGLFAEFTGLPENLSFAAQSAYELGFPPAQFDLVVGAEVLEHLDDPEAALAEVDRVASGHVLVSVPREPLWRVLNVARFSYLKDFGNTPGHLQHWSSRRFERLISRRFDVLGVRRPLPWTMILARKRG
jgi:ubiquinone/menaquinone biosynthesis C-methylase UbiE